MNFDPKLWEGWGIKFLTITKAYEVVVDGKADMKMLVVDFNPNKCNWEVRVDNNIIATKDTQQEALKVANAIGGWE